MVSKVSKNKKAKADAMKLAGFKLFTEKGVNDTSIDDIVKEAGVGKGTFYLYFDDKYDLLETLISQEGIDVLHNAALETKERDFESFEEEILYFIDSIIDYSKNNKAKVRLIHKSLTWSTIKKAIDRHEEVREIYDNFARAFSQKKSPGQIDIMLFMIIDLVGSVTYSSLILKEPAEIDQVKPILYSGVLGIIRG